MPIVWNNLGKLSDTLYKEMEVEDNWGFPIVKPPIKLEVPRYLMSYGNKHYKEYKRKHSYVHFFDGMFKDQEVWSKPAALLSKISYHIGMISPGMNLINEPKCKQVYNIYKSRYVAALGQLKIPDFNVIPTVSFAEENTYEFCFEGLPKNGIYAVNAVGYGANIIPLDLFINGYKELVNRLDPVLVLSYGGLPEEVKPLCEYFEYPTYIQDPLGILHDRDTVKHNYYKEKGEDDWEPVENLLELSELMKQAS